MHLFVSYQYISLPLHFPRPTREMAQQQDALQDRSRGQDRIPRAALQAGLKESGPQAVPRRVYFVAC